MYRFSFWMFFLSSRKYLNALYENVSCETQAMMKPGLFQSPSHQGLLRRNRAATMLSCSLTQHAEGSMGPFPYSVSKDSVCGNWQQLYCPTPPSIYRPTRTSIDNWCTSVTVHQTSKEAAFGLGVVYLGATWGQMLGEYSTIHGIAITINPE